MIEVWYYVTAAGENIFESWLNDLADPKAQARVAIRITRLAAGNFGDCKPLQDGIWELRINWGPGYRVYYAMAGKSVVLLLCGGDKRKQMADIDRAIKYWHDYNQRTKKS